MTFLCDTGERYLSKLYNDEWMRENQLLEPDRVTLGDLLAAQGRRGAIDARERRPGTTVRQALGLMRLHDVSQLPVMDGGECVGSVSEYVADARGLESSRVPRCGRQRGDGRSRFPWSTPGSTWIRSQKLLSKANPAVLVRRAGTIARDRDAERHARVSDVEMSADTRSGAANL